MLRILLRSRHFGFGISPASSCHGSCPPTSSDHVRTRVPNVHEEELLMPDHFGPKLAQFQG